MRKGRVIMCKSSEIEIDSGKQELLKEIFGSLHVSPERIEELIRQVKKGIKTN